MSQVRWPALMCVAGATVLAGFVWFRNAGVEYQPFADGELVGYYERSKRSQAIRAVHAWFRSTGTLHLRADFRTPERFSLVWDPSGNIQRESLHDETKVSPPWSEAARAASPDRPIPEWLTTWLEERDTHEEAHRSLMGSATNTNAMGANLR